MRYIFFLRGLPGSGKTTFIAQKNLQAYTLSLDLFLTPVAPILDFSGRLRVGFEFGDDFIFPDQNPIFDTNHDKLLNVLKIKMKIGELIFIDINNINNEYLQKYQKLIEFYRYKAYCIDFSDVSLEICKQRNQNRTDFKYTEDEVLEKMQNSPIPDFAQTITPDQLDTVLNLPPFDASKYTKIHHFGDLQGCLKPLTEYFNQYPIQDNELYIFVGDYVDRGSENHLVVDFILQNSHRDNFILLEGNHERHLWNWSLGLKAEHDEFELKTKPQLDQANISPVEVQKLFQKIQNFAYYTFDDKKVVVSHGGLSTIPENFTFINTDQIIRGVGLYEQSQMADDAFAQNTPDNCFSIHGHRNYYRNPTQINPKCFNLEGKVEFDGNLRVVTLSHIDNSTGNSTNGFKIIEIHNPIQSN